MLSSIYSSKRSSDEGFTLIELLVVVIIIGILAAIALPVFIDQQKVAIDASVQSDVRNSVTNVTNAQAQDATTAKAALSREGTILNLATAAFGAVAATSSDAKRGTEAEQSFSNVPKLGAAYTLSGYNAGGKKFDSTAKEYTFTSATGLFTTEDRSGGASADEPAGGSYSGGSNTPGVATDASFSGTLNDLSFNGYTGVLNGGGSSSAQDKLVLSAGWFSTDEDPITSGPAFAHGQKPYGPDGSNSDTGIISSSTLSNVKLKSADGASFTATGWNCSLSDYYLNKSYFPLLGFSGYDHNGISAFIQCFTDTDSNLLTSDIATKLKGGSVTFTTPSGTTDTVKISAPVPYTAPPVKATPNRVIASKASSGSAYNKQSLTWNFDTGTNGNGQVVSNTGEATVSDIATFNGLDRTNHYKNEQFLGYNAGQVAFLDKNGNDVTSSITDPSVRSNTTVDNCRIIGLYVKASSGTNFQDQASASISCNWGRGERADFSDIEPLLEGGSIVLGTTEYKLSDTLTGS